MSLKCDLDGDLSRTYYLQSILNYQIKLVAFIEIKDQRLARHGCFCFVENDS